MKQPPICIGRTEDEAVAMGTEVGYPLIVRPSYVLGGRAMEIVHNEDDLRMYIKEAAEVSNDSPVLLDRILEQAVKVDAICDGTTVLVGGIMEHIEHEGIV